MIRVLLITLLWFTTTPTAHAQRGRGPVLDAQRLASAFRQRAWTIQEGKIRIVSDIDPDTRVETFAKTRWLFSTIELVFDGMRTRRPSDGVEVFYAGDRNDYLSLIAVEAKADGSNTAGMAAYGGRRTMLFVKGLAWRTIQHEAWHASRSVFIPDMPTWLDEGVAEVFEHGTFLEDQFVIGGVGVPEQDLLRRRARICEMMPVARTLQEPVELQRGVLLALLVKDNADDGRRALRCHWLERLYGFARCRRHTTAAAIGSAGAQPRAVAAAQ